MGREFQISGQMVALLHSGVILTDLQTDVMPLIAEMEYVLVEVPLQWDDRILAYGFRLRRERLRRCPGVWWRSTESVSLIADSLETTFFCVVDDFLASDLAEKLLSNIFNSKLSTSLLPCPTLVMAKGCYENTVTQEYQVSLSLDTSSPLKPPR